MDSRGHADGAQAPSVGGRLGLSLFFLFFFALGSLFELFLVREFGRALGQRFWAKVPCRIVASEVRERDDREEPFAFAVRYEYDYAGGPHTGSAYKRNYSGSGKYSDAQSLMQKHPVGLRTVCYVNPDNPGAAVLRRDSLAIGLAVLFPLIFVAIGAGGIYFLWRKRPPETQKPIAATASNQSSKGLGRYGLAGLFGIFAIAGGALLYPLGIRPIARTISAESWITTPCQVLRAEVRSHDGDDGTTYSVYILYQYEFNSQTYKSDRYEFVGGSSSGYQGKARIVEQYRTAPQPVCYVNPKSPSEAVLQRGFHAKLLLALFPLPFLLIGVGGLIGTLRGKPAGAVGTAPSWIPRPSARAPDHLAVLRTTDSGRTILAPTFSAKTKFIGMIVVALFWNGIVSLFVGNVIEGFRHGDPSWFGLLFLLPFVAVGVGLIAGAVYQFLAMFNPRPTVELSTSVIPLGGAAELRWSFSGRTSRIREFTLALRGTEEAKYRRGTSTYTDRSTFYEMELYRTADPREVAAGQVGLVLPQDTMHSFAAENNKILWSLEIRGEIQGWPDVKESFPITVTPRGGGATT
jgi:hypothetical protein